MFHQLNGLNTGLKSLGLFQGHLLSRLHIKMLAKARPNEDFNVAKRKKWFFGGFDKKITKIMLGMLGGFSLPLYKLSMQILIL